MQAMLTKHVDSAQSKIVKSAHQKAPAGPAKMATIALALNALTLALLDSSSVRIS